MTPENLSFLNFWIPSLGDWHVHTICGGMKYDLDTQPNIYDELFHLYL